MSRNTGTFNFAANFEVLAKAPLDAKQLVGTKADLINPAIWSGSTGVWLYDGAIVSVASDPIPENNGIYFLASASTYTDINSWIKAGTGEGGGTITGGTNGLSQSGANITLGGDLLSGTTINGQGVHSLQLTDVDGLIVSTTGGTDFIADNIGFSLSFSGGSVTFDDDGGLKYGGDYSGGFTSESIPDVAYVTGLTGTYLKLDQTTPQDVCYGQPYFHEGLILHEFPLPSLVTGHTVGKMFYDPFYETITAQIGHPDTCGNAVNLQLGQEMHRLVWNETGVEILNGDVVRTVSTHCGGGICADTPAVCLAKADSMICGNVIGVATQVISASTYGFITTVGYVSDIDTTSGKYSGFTTGDIIYLSPTIDGGVTNTPPASPNIQYRLGRLTTTGTTAKLNVDLELVYRLDDLADVNASTPSLDDVLKWNGLDWVNGVVGSASASAGINFYYATPIINAVSSPAGISNAGVGNGIQVATFSKIPVTTGGTIVLAALSASDTQAFAAWGRETPIERTTIDAGLWEFYDYISVDTVVGTTYLIHGMYQIVDVTGSTITTTGAGTTRTATITSGEFTGDYFNPDAINTNASFLQTPSGLFQISASASTNSITIVTPSVYVNESGVSGSTWNKLFTGSTESIENTTPLYQTKIVAPAFNVSTTDKLGQISIVSASGAYTLSLSYNGTSAASFLISPLVTLHNDLAGLQGGSNTERYHLDTGQVAVVNATSGVNTGDETSGTIQAKLTGTITTHNHYYSGLTGLPDLTKYQSVSGFTGYTATTQPVIDTAITGATNLGTGTTIYSGTTGRSLNLHTFVGSGGTVVQKVGDEIIITSDTASGSQQYSGQTPSAVDLCGITIGYELTGKTVSCIIQDLLVPELFQTSVGTPSTSLSATLTGTREIGCAFSQLLTPNYSAGAVTPLYCTDNGTTRGGAANNYSYTGPSVSAGFSGCTSCNLIGYVVTSGANTWSVCTRYDEGACVKGSKGTVNPSYPTVCAQDSCTAAGSASITGILPWYWGTKASGTITGADVAAGTKTVAVVGASTPICFDAVTEYLWFAAPAGTYTTKTKWWVCAANAGAVGGVGQLWAASCSVAVTSTSGCWTGCSFDVYVTCGITTTAAGIPMCLYY